MKRIRRKQSGLGMLEIVITIFLVTLGLLVVMSSFVAISKSGRYGERMNVATTLARLEMERIRNQPYAAVQNATGADGEYPDHPGYYHAVQVHETGTVKEVVLQVFFEHGRRRAEMRTYVSNL